MQPYLSTLFSFHVHYTFISTLVRANKACAMCRISLFMVANWLVLERHSK